MKLSKLFDGNLLREALIIRSDYFEKTNEFILFGEIPNIHLSRGERSFFKLTLSQILNLEHRKGLFKLGKFEPRKYKVNFSKFTVDLQYLKVNIEDNNHILFEFWFGYNFGNLFIKCEACSLEQRIFIGRKQANDKWLFYERDTNKLADIYNPW